MTNLPSKNKNYKIALYIRVSTEEQAENPEGSIKNQEQRLRDAVRYRNQNSSFGEIVTVYTDAGISAKDMKRPQLQAMLKAIRNKEIDLVMVTELSRLSRNNRDFLGMWDMMHDCGCRFMSLREDFDTTTAAGEMLLFQLMNFAQFERKQTSERVSANISARASRGLYNGGAIPIGYKRIPEKLGYLAIDEDAALTVKAAFDAFLREDCLSHAAKWLNDNGYSIKRHREGGGSKARVGHFTVDNLHDILRNKMYVGLKTYTDKGVEKETKAVWTAIIDELTFKRANDKLAKNRHRLKPFTKERFPYLLSGISHCMTCGDFMPGKTATGKRAKIGYYEHSWGTKKDSTLSKKIFKCDPHRVLSKKVEPLVWQELVRFVTDTKFIAEMMENLKLKSQENPQGKERERLKIKVSSYNSQLEAMAERLSQLPKTVSPAPIFKQMEKIEAHKKEAELALEQQSYKESPVQNIVKLETFEKFSEQYRRFLTEKADFATRKQMLQKFIKRVEMGTETIKIYWNLDEHHYTKELALKASSLSSEDQKRQRNTLSDFKSDSASKILGFGCSKSLTFGAQ